RMMKMERPDDVTFVLVSYLPIPGKVGEMKTKPTQYAARTLNSAGIQADFIVCRGEKEIDQPRREQLATFCMIEKENAISSPDAESIDEVPLIFERQDFGNKISKKFKLSQRQTDLSQWKQVFDKSRAAEKEVQSAVVGKYCGTGDFTLADSYISVIESVKIACW